MADARVSLGSVLKTAVVLCFVGLSVGCQQRITDFTVLSTKNVDLSRMNNLQRGDRRVEGEDLKHIIVFVPVGIPDVKEAIDKAIEGTPGAVGLVDGVLHAKYFYIPFIYGWHSYVVEGTPLIDPAAAGGTSSTGRPPAATGTRLPASGSGGRSR